MKLIHGGCLQELPHIPDKSIDMILTDLPYGTTACKWDNIIPFEPMWNEVNRIIKDNGAVVLFGSEPFSSHLRLSNIKNYKYDWIWIKHKPSNFSVKKYQPMKYHELIHIFYSRQCLYKPIMKKRSNNTVQRCINAGYKAVSTHNSDLNSLGTISRSFNNFDPNNKLPSMNLDFSGVVSTSNEKINHPTQKPVKLLEYLIRTYTNESEIVLDFTMGSGSTGVACLNCNRDFIGIEQDKNYFDIATKRINNVPDRLF